MVVDVYNAFISQVENPVVLGSTPGPLAGLSYAVKDNIDTADLPTTAGTRALLGSVPKQDAPVLTPLRSSGAVMLGKLNMHELALGTTSDNGAFGAVLNPVDTTRSPGGSSGGSAAAVAGGLVDFALGSDTGGSMRIPASFCGIVGMRPSMGRYPHSGMVPISHTRDTAGVMARTVELVALVDEVITGDGTAPNIPVESLRLGLPRTGFFNNLDPEVETVVEFALMKIAEAGVTLIEVEVKDAIEIGIAAGFPIAAYEMTRDLMSYVSTLLAPYNELTFAQIQEQVLTPDVAENMMHMITGPVTDEHYRQCRDLRTQLQQNYADAFATNSVDALLAPVAPIVAPPLHATEIMHRGEMRALFPLTIQNTDPGSLAGQPSLSIPIPRAEGTLPVGLGIEGPMHSDRRLLAIAQLLTGILAEG